MPPSRKEELITVSPVPAGRLTRMIRISFGAMNSILMSRCWLMDSSRASLNRCFTRAIAPRERDAFDDAPIANIATPIAVMATAQMRSSSRMLNPASP